MKKLLFLFIIVPSLFLQGKAQPTDVYKLFPNLGGWEKEFNYEVYTPNDLWDYIDGAADAYLSQEFVDLHIAEYSKGQDVIRAEIYRHKDDDHGFGIYSQERSPDLNFIDIGAKAYQEGAILNFLNGNYYVKIYASTEKKSVTNAMKNLAEQISKTINRDPKLPAILSFFPSENHISNADAFISTNFMGHEFLNSVYKASYKTGDTSFNMFIIRALNAAACEQILRKYMEFAKQGDEKLSQGRLIIHDPYNGSIEILWKDNLIMGVSNTDDKDLAWKYLEKAVK